MSLLTFHPSALSSDVPDQCADFTLHCHNQWVILAASSALFELAFFTFLFYFWDLLYNLQRLIWPSSESFFFCCCCLLTMKFDIGGKSCVI